MSLYLAVQINCGALALMALFQLGSQEGYSNSLQSQLLDKPATLLPQLDIQRIVLALKFTQITGATVYGHYLSSIFSCITIEREGNGLCGVGISSAVGRWVF